MLSSLNNSLVQVSWLLPDFLDPPCCQFVLFTPCGSVGSKRLDSSLYPQLTCLVSGRAVRRWERQEFDHVVFFIFLAFSQVYSDMGARNVLNWSRVKSSRSNLSGFNLQWASPLFACGAATNLIAFWQVYPLHISRLGEFKIATGTG